MRTSSRRAVTSCSPCAWTARSAPTGSTGGAASLSPSRCSTLGTLASNGRYVYAYNIWPAPKGLGARNRREGRRCALLGAATDPRGGAVPGPRRRTGRLAVRLDEPQHALPGVLGSVREVLLLAVEEAVRRARIRDELVRDAGRASASSKAALSSAVMFLSSPACSARIGHAISGARWIGPGEPSWPLARAPVEADGAGEAVAARGREPRVAAAHAEADREDRRSPRVPAARRRTRRRRPGSRPASRPARVACTRSRRRASRRRRCGRSSRRRSPRSPARRSAARAPRRSDRGRGRRGG